jgi:hypothetical protein
MAYVKVENILIKPNPNAFISKDATHILSNIPVIKVKPRQIKYFDWIEDNDIEKIKQFLDTEYSDKPVRTYLTKGGEKKEI